MAFKKYISYLKVALVRGFVPLNTILFILSFNDPVDAKNFSFYIAVVQVLSNVDFGINAKLLSTARINSFGKVFLYYSYYITRYFYVKIFAVIFIFVFSFFTFNLSWDHVYILSFLSAEVFIIYNLCSNTSISEGDYSLIVKLIACISAFQTVSMLSVVFYDIELGSKIAILIYFLSFLFGVICVSPSLFRARCQAGSIDASSDFMWRLQVSQLSSSLIVNKDFILLYIFSYSNQAAIYATAARVMLIPIQLNSVIISKLWVDIANSKLELNKFRYNMKLIFLISFFSGIIPFCLSYYFLMDKSGYIFFLLLFLMFFIICNAYSALSSAYATVDGYAIPTVNWYIFSTIIVIAISLLLYYSNMWLISILVSCVYFLLLGKRNLKDIKWM